MTVVDFIDMIDDIIDLSSDEETVQQDHVTTQLQGTLLDRQAVFVLADEGRQDGQAAFVSAVEGSQKTTESGNALVATTLPLVIEEAPLDTAAESKKCPSSPTSAPLPSTTSTTPKTLPSEVSYTQPVATTSTSVMEKAPLDIAESKYCPCSPASAPLPSLSYTTPKALAFEVGDTKLVATASPSVMKKVPLDTAGLKNSHSSPASAPLPSPDSTTPKALSSEVGDRKLVRVKHLKKNYHTSTPRRVLDCANVITIIWKSWQLITRGLACSSQQTNQLPGQTMQNLQKASLPTLQTKWMQLEELVKQEIIDICIEQLRKCYCGLNGMTCTL